jgi:hypothetical protein
MLSLVSSMWYSTTIAYVPLQGWLVPEDLGTSVRTETRRWGSQATSTMQVRINVRSPSKRNTTRPPTLGHMTTRDGPGGVKAEPQSTQLQAQREGGHTSLTRYNCRLSSTSARISFRASHNYDNGSSEMEVSDEWCVRHQIAHATDICRCCYILGSSSMAFHDIRFRGHDP